ncbi:hypothetical protein KQ939_00600 [Planococcus sp. CP5-4]|uniref:hypothetical protein n=1 Tax=unclassified Planococcus (in: firmicutes) TaxID=2662419 RepID=UPI001C211416|nr:MULTISPECIES: hypothetical protein [unclassified Planococcus (in: firmicutes)]MBU9673366.1 hypothetical protein [Planococcus sp. CP5-4_YE]MBV0908139.1 hypothetical protein [Planococcus sp. CP5-4_UN]MBW6062200.1 hypothetical protein [Planococcus sp. CP5-4]
MRKTVKIILGILGFIFLGVVVLVILFILSMKPDPDREEKIRQEAGRYLEANFNDDFELYDTLYDNMGNFEFEYAAKVRVIRSNTEFLVYRDAETKQLVDTYVSDKWSDELEEEMSPYVRQAFGESAVVYVYIDDEIGVALNVDPLNPGSFKNYNLEPTVRLDIPRKRLEGDEERFTDFISYLTIEEILQHGQLIVSYVAETGEILEDKEWIWEF